MHLDAYSVGEGNRQTGRQRRGESAITRRNVTPLVYWTDADESYLTLGNEQISIDRAARAAITLAEVVERVRAKHQQLAIERLSAAIKRQVDACE
jgi:hypothetical protein